MREHAPAKWLAVAAAAFFAACSADGGDSSTRVGDDVTGAGAGGGVGGGSAGAGGGDNFVPGGGGGSPGGGNGGTGASDPNECARLNVDANRVTPQVTLVVDGSGSMENALGTGGSRWQALRSALLGQNGVVRDLQGIVQFGMSIYSTGEDGGGMCPVLDGVDPAVNNFEPINMAFPQAPPGGFTPTGEALQAVVDSLADQTVKLDQQDTGEQIIVLATDGEPNGCDAIGMLLGQIFGAIGGMAPEPNYGPTEDAVRAAQQKNINTYVISLAPNLTDNAHLQTVANLGQGLDPAASPGAQIYSPTDPAQLEEALRGLVGDVVGCELNLQGTLTVENACSGEVLLNSQPLKCDGPNGWEVVDETTIRLLGSACEEWKNNAAALIDASFPCDVIKIE